MRVLGSTYVRMHAERGSEREREREREKEEGALG